MVYGGIGKRRAGDIAREFFVFEPEKLHDLMAAVLRVETVRYPLPHWLTEQDLRAKLASTRALFADSFKVVL